MKKALDSQNALSSIPTIQTYLEDLIRALQSISHKEIAVVIEVLYQAWLENKQVFICGNGGSAATASHMVNDLNKLASAKGKPRIKAISLVDNIPLVTAWSNDSDYRDIFAEQLVNFLQSGDVLISISTSGMSENVLRAVEYANENHSVTVAFTGDKGGRLANMVDHCVYIPDSNICIQEDGHMVLDHIIATTLRLKIARTDKFKEIN
jgi:D-sedoheptulose 7-phosphate isomerase